MSYLSVVQREIKRFYPRPLAWFITFIFPFSMCLLICFIFSSGSPKDLPVGVWNADNSKLSRLITRNINALPSCKIQYQLTNLEEGRQLLVEGKIYAFIVIPKNFERDVYRLTRPELVFYYNNQRILIGGIISKDINSLIQTMLVGMDAKIKNKHGVPYKFALKQSHLINVVEHVHSNPYFNYQYFLSIAAFGHILQISIILSTIWVIGEEFKKGTTKEWLKEADDSVIKAVLGKLTPCFTVFTILFALLYLIYFGIYGVPFVGNLFLGILSTIFFILSCMALGICFISINGNFRYCLSAGAFYTTMGFALAGITYPVIAMPLIAKIYNATMPLNYWAQIMIDQSLRNIPPCYNLKQLFIFLIMISIGFISLYRLKKIMIEEKRWYKL